MPTVEFFYKINNTWYKCRYPEWNITLCSIVYNSGPITDHYIFVLYHHKPEMLRAVWQKYLTMSTNTNKNYRVLKYSYINWYHPILLSTNVSHYSVRIVFPLCPLLLQHVENKIYVERIWNYTARILTFPPIPKIFKTKWVWIRHLDMGWVFYYSTSRTVYYIIYWS